MAEKREFLGMTATAPILGRRKTDIIDIHLGTDSEENRHITDLINEISTVTMLSSDMSDEVIAEYSEFVELVNELKYLLNCELTNEVEYDDLETIEDWNEVQSKIYDYFQYVYYPEIRRYRDRYRDRYRYRDEYRYRYEYYYDPDDRNRLNELKRYLIQIGLLSEGERQQLSIRNPVVAEVSLFYLLMCKYGRRMQNYYRLSLFLNFLPFSSYLDFNNQYVIRNEIIGNGSRNFEQNLSSFNFMGFCQSLNSYYYDTVKNLNTQVVKFNEDDFGDIDSVRELIEVLSSVEEDVNPQKSKNNKNSVRRYIESAGSGCYAVLDLGKEKYGALSGTYLPSKTIDSIQDQLRDTKYLKNIFTSVPNSVRYYYNPYKYITRAQFNEKSDNGKDYENYHGQKDFKCNRMFSCTERKLLTYENVPELFHFSGLSVTLCVKMYPCYMCKLSIEAMQRDYSHRFIIKIPHKNRSAEESSYIDSLYDNNRTAYDAIAMDVVVELMK